MVPPTRSEWRNHMGSQSASRGVTIAQEEAEIISGTRTLSRIADFSLFAAQSRCDPVDFRSSEAFPPVGWLRTLDLRMPGAQYVPLSVRRWSKWRLAERSTGLP